MGGNNRNTNGNFLLAALLLTMSGVPVLAILGHALGFAIFFGALATIALWKYFALGLLAYLVLRFFPWGILESFDRPTIDRSSEADERRKRIAHVFGRPIDRLTRHSLDERGYVLRDELTEEDWQWNLDQMDNELGAKSAHRGQFALWGAVKKGFIERLRESA